jgi:hypothetical protein
VLCFSPQNFNLKIQKKGRELIGLMNILNARPAKEDGEREGDMQRKCSLERM